MRATIAPVAVRCGTCTQAPYGERLVLLEIARLGNFERRSRRLVKRLGRDVPGVPRPVRRSASRCRGLPSDVHGSRVARALAQRRVKMQASAGDQLGLDRLGPWPSPATCRTRRGRLCGGHRLLPCRRPARSGTASTRPVFGRGHEHDRRRVLDVAVHRALRGVVEERRQLIELALA